MLWCVCNAQIFNHVGDIGILQQSEKLAFMNSNDRHTLAVLTSMFSYLDVSPN
jgi:hypothetical protein